MKERELRVDVRLSHKYNSYSCGITVEIEEGDDQEAILKKMWRRCKAEAERQIQVEGL